MANRLAPLLTTLVGPEQAGFVPGCSLTYNTRTVFGAMQHIKPETKAASIFLDAEKAFDSVEWHFMWAVLECMGLGPIFIQLIRTLHADPSARIRIGSAVTPLIKISRGTRQGCPLSPLLYALVAEPLACTSREHHSHRGIRFPDYNLIISAYADDTLLYIRDPASNAPPVLREVVQFGGFSGLKINWTKSVVFPLTPVTTPEELEFPLTWTTEPVCYLGIQLHTDPEVICTENYGRAVGKLEADISRWIRLSLSLLGRISIMKMVLLPRFLFLFMNIPLLLPAHFFKYLRSLQIKLAWAGKQLRMSWDLLTLPYSMDGLGAPDLELYYHAAQASHAYHSIHQTPSPPHLHIEKVPLAPAHLASALFQLTHRLSGSLDSINATAHAWRNLLKRQALTILYSPITPIEWCYWLPTLVSPDIVTTLHSLGVDTIDSFKDGRGITWDELPLPDPPPTPLVPFQYFRARTALRTLLGHDLLEPPEMPILTTLIHTDSPSRLVSHIYTKTQNLRRHQYTKARLKWHSDLGHQLDDKTWQYCCEATKRISLNGRHRLIQFKFLNRIYYTPSRLYRYGLRQTAACECCEASDADFLHLAWTCPAIETFWLGIFAKLSAITQVELQPDPLLALLGFSKKLRKESVDSLIWVY